jgi:tetratricopeptide (TPR) repeat protein
MIHLQKERFEQSLDQLRKAELVARGSIQFKSTTYNNLACYYRRTGKIRTALTYLIQALELELKIDQPKTLADTHLNLCAVLSQLDRHEDALQHVMLSIILLQDEFLQTVLPKTREEKSGEVSDERLAVLAIAYHNLGVEFEHLKRVPPLRPSSKNR